LVIQELVDDETDINLALKVTLEEEGFKVDTFDDPSCSIG
jgi:DNA-binding response OmpR family regulator